MGYVIMILLASVVIAYIIIDERKMSDNASWKSFDLEFYTRCHLAGLDEEVRTEEQVQQASKILQEMLTEESFARTLKEQYLKADWMNKRLKHGKWLFAQKESMRQKAEEEAAAKRAEEEERLRMYEAAPHRLSWYMGHCELEMDTIHISTSGWDPHDCTYQISDITNIAYDISCVNNYDILRIYTRGRANPDIIYFRESLPNEQKQALFAYLVKCSALPKRVKEKMLHAETCYVDSFDYTGEGTSYRGSSRSDKGASVVGRAAAGWVIGGPAGGVIGALSAVDKNNKRNRK